VAKGRRTQLLIEALIAAEGGFEDLAGGAISGFISCMEYWQLSGRRGKIAFPVDVMPSEWTAQDVRDQLTDLVTSFDDPATAYASEPDKEHALPYSNYRHLARLAEWQTEANDD
jgi:ATP-dependent helicase/nuclease subunit B